MERDLISQRNVNIRAKYRSTVNSVIKNLDHINDMIEEYYFTIGQEMNRLLGCISSYYCKVENVTCVTESLKTSLCEVDMEECKNISLIHLQHSVLETVPKYSYPDHVISQSKLYVNNILDNIVKIVEKTRLREINRLVRKLTEDPNLRSRLQSYILLQIRQLVQERILQGVLDSDIKTITSRFHDFFSKQDLYIYDPEDYDRQVEIRDQEYRDYQDQYDRITNLEGDYGTHYDEYVDDCHRCGRAAGDDDDYEDWLSNTCY